jgi:hypothetical protein
MAVHEEAVMRNVILSAGFAMALVQAAMAGLPQAGLTQRSDPSQSAADFAAGVQRYVELHRALEGTVPTVAVSDDYGTVLAAIDALAVKIQGARRHARRGDVFTPGVERWLREMITRALEGCDIEAIVQAIDEENPPGVVFAPHVNGRWPPSASLAPVPPQVLAALPRLPDELQYRFLHRDLILWDVHANVIVDFIRKALP